MPTDHRLLHLAADEKVEWRSCPARPVRTCEAVKSAVDRMDLARCGQRAQGMRAAHAQVEKSLPRETLTLAVLTEWHSVACPRAGLRHAPWAFAKGGAERYSLDNDLLDQRLQVLGDQPPLARALRAYLDILFFHPYDDGNSRAARLAFHFFLGRDGPDLRIADPLFRLAIPAGQVRAYTLFQDLAHRCLR